MKVIIWGSRGSLPASMRSEGVRHKIYTALETARECHLKTKDEINNFIDTKLPFNIKSSYI